MFKNVKRYRMAGPLRPRLGVDANEIQVNCGRCGKSIALPLADLQNQRLVTCAACARIIERRKELRLVLKKDPGP